MAASGFGGFSGARNTPAGLRSAGNKRPGSVRGGALGFGRGRNVPTGFRNLPSANLPPVATTNTPAAPAAPQSDPRDSTYWANVMAHAAATNQSINQMHLQDTQDNLALQQALGQLAYQQPLDQLTLMGKANQAGNLYSSVYGSNAGQLANSYQQKNTAAQNAYAQQHAGLLSQIAAAQQNEPLYQGQQLGLADQRAAALATNQIGLGLAPATTTPATTAPRAPAAPRVTAPRTGGRTGRSTGRSPRMTLNLPNLSKWR